MRRFLAESSDESRTSCAALKKVCLAARLESGKQSVVAQSSDEPRICFSVVEQVLWRSR